MTKDFTATASSARCFARVIGDAKIQGITKSDGLLVESEGNSRPRKNQRAGQRLKK